MKYLHVFLVVGSLMANIVLLLAWALHALPTVIALPALLVILVLQLCLLGGLK